nr:MAG TPA: hypothetical protein [Caudoviricetes sp.]
MMIHTFSYLYKILQIIFFTSLKLSYLQKNKNTKLKSYIFVMRYSLLIDL